MHAAAWVHMARAHTLEARPWLEDDFHHRVLGILVLQLGLSRAVHGGEDARGLLRPLSRAIRAVKETPFARQAPIRTSAERHRGSGPQQRAWEHGP